MSSPALDPDLAHQLQRHAQTAAQRAYAPYSQFFVGAAILLETGQIVSGCNVENASFRLTTCAEQTAIVSAVSLYGPSIRIRALALHSRSHAPCQPCGACLQTIAEFAPPSAILFFPAPTPGAGTDTSPCTLADLLPSTFRLAPQP